MSIGRTISIDFWNDAKIEEFSPEDRYVMLYLLTNPLTNLCGCYEITVNRMSRETGYTVECVRAIIKRLEHTFNVIWYEEETKELLIVNWHKYNWTKSPKLDKPLAEAIDKVKAHRFKNHLIDLFQNTRSIPYPYGIDTLCEAPISISNTKSITNTEAEAEPKQRAKRFVKPTYEEVAAFVYEGEFDVDPRAFYDYYESNGWRVGKSPMKDWCAAVRSWHRRNSPKGVTANASSSRYASRL